MLSFFLAALESDADRQMFVEVYAQHHSKMENTAIRILKNQSDAEDAVQNAFMQVIRHFEKIFHIPCEDFPHCQWWALCRFEHISIMLEMR